MARFLSVFSARLSPARFLLLLAAGTVLTSAGWISAPSQPDLPGPFAVILDHHNGSAPASVLNMRSGQITGRVRVPVAGSSFLWVAAAVSDRAFVLADVTPNLRFRFYRLRLSAAGHPTALTALRVPAPHGAQIYGMALSANADKLAVAWVNGPAFPPVAEIRVTSLRTGATRTWSGPVNSAATDVSWAGNRAVVFDWQATTRPARSGVRVLDTEGPGVSVLASRPLIPASTRFAGLHGVGRPEVTPDGSAIYAVMSDRHDNNVLVEFSGRTGAPIRRVIPVAQPRPTTRLLVCGILVTDGTGQHLIVQCGTTQARIVAGGISPVRLHMLVPLSPVGWANDFAW